MESADPNEYAVETGSRADGFDRIESVVRET